MARRLVRTLFTMEGAYAWIASTVAQHPYISCAAVVVAAYAAMLLVRGAVASRRLRARVRSYARPSSKLAWGVTRKPVLVLVNPYGGSGQALQLTRSILAPMAAASDVRLDVVATQRRGHARDIARNLDLAKYSVVVCVSGDGMVHEVINGLAEQGRAGGGDGPSAIRRVPLCILPGGTSNGIATNITSRDFFTACRSLLEGSPHDGHLMRASPLCDGPTGAHAWRARLQTGANDPVPPVWDAHVFSWAIVAQHDHLVERSLRWMGKALKQLYAPVHVILQRKQHTGRLTFRAAAVPASAKGYSDASKLPVATVAPGGAASPGEAEEAAEGWRVIEGDDIVFCCAAAMPWASHDCVFAPGLPLNVGAVDLIVMRGPPSRLQLAKSFTAMETGTHPSNAWVEVYRATAFSLRPGGRSPVDLDLSGEDYPAAPVRVECHASAAVFWYKPHTGDAARFLS